jgi:hypothetical protein
MDGMLCGLSFFTKRDYFELNPLSSVIVARF